MWQCCNKRLSTEKTLVMGIINVTPDSFFAGSRVFDSSTAVNRAVEFLDNGADILDIGGESTRPGADAVDCEEECRRILPVIDEVLRLRPDAVISVDTWHFHVAKAALEHGVAIINDIKGVEPQDGMWRLIIDSGAGYVLMHSKGTPKTMDAMTIDERSVVRQIKNSLETSLEKLCEAGCAIEQIMLDPGLGFALTNKGSMALLAATKELSQKAPVLIGASRKRFLGEYADENNPDLRGGASIGAALWAASQGAAVVRVHDVKETADALKIFFAAKESANE